MKALFTSFIFVLTISCNSSISGEKTTVVAYTKTSISKKRILFVTSNAHFYGNSNIESTNHFPEIIFAYHEFIKAGFDIDFVSPQGGAIAIGYIHSSDSITKKYLYDEKFMDKLENTYLPKQIDYAQYIAVYYSGGGSAMFTVPENKEIQQISMNIYEKNGGVISAICHGTAGIANLKLSDSTFLVANRKITGFPDVFENKESQYFKEFPFSIQEKIIENGGDFIYSKEGWDNYHIQEGRIVTGQDPTSASLIAKKVIEILKHQKIN
ncbi:type 1 glutamine amidotransferase domain-containing protein [Aquimarina mytili]|uniref:Type 1 glutamine amidotransferase domain-containing protein n=1 Tax=Aquimarina mytili TaxID=874423 RepID=A0A936ZQD3_9FLAO|nr:type 1 glutamine amidotransferase domain-containing protein [Aquimarina mytili]MBL0682372.1 type 1 glutamine amidotransferase domain-containing protein [Aquimarina mytili]